MAKNAATGAPLFETESTLHRFLLVIEPDPALSALVAGFKRDLAGRIGSFIGRHSIPHITLFFADLPAECERDVIEGVAAGVVGQPSFPLRYDGVKHFPDQKTIYVDPVEKAEIAQLRQNIVEQVRAYPSVQDGIRPTEHPHLTIAGGLRSAQFRESWDFLAPHTHQSEQIVDRVVLLKRLLEPGERYVHVRSFPLG